MDGHLPFLVGSPTNPRMVTRQKEVYYRHGIGTYKLLTKLKPGDNCHGWSTTIIRKVVHKPYHPQKSHPPTQGWSPTKRNCSRDMELGTYTLLTKLAPGDNCYGQSPTIPRIVTHQPQDGLPQEGSVVELWNLAPTHYSQNQHQVTTSIDGHLPSLGQSPIYPRMVTHEKDVYYRHGIWHFHITHKTNSR